MLVAWLGWAVVVTVGLAGAVIFVRSLGAEEFDRAQKIPLIIRSNTRPTPRTVTQFFIVPFYRNPSAVSSGPSTSKIRLNAAIMLYMANGEIFTPCKWCRYPVITESSDKRWVVISVGGSGTMERCFEAAPSGSLLIMPEEINFWACAIQRASGLCPRKLSSKLPPELTS